MLHHCSLRTKKKNNDIEMLTEGGASVNMEPGVQSTLNLDQTSKLSVPGLAVEGTLRNSIGVMRSQNIDGSSMASIESNPQAPVIKVSRSHISIKELQRRFTMPATMPASANVLPANNNYEGGGSRNESWTAAQREQRRVSIRKDIVRPLYRKDIFYSGSIVNLPQYRQSKSDIRTYISNITLIPEVDENVDRKESMKSKHGRLCPRLPKSMTDTLQEALDFSLLRQPEFLLTCIANIFGMMGFYVPFYFITESSVEKGVTREAAAFLLSIIGITNLLGRLIFGWVVDKLKVKALNVNNMCLTVSGISILTTPFCFTYSTIMAVCIMFSLFVSAYISLTSIILVDMVGLDRLTNSFGLLSLFRGAASIIGPPLAGSVYDWTGSYDIPFFIAGGLLITSAICTSFIPWLNKKAPVDITITTA